MFEGFKSFFFGPAEILPQDYKGPVRMNISPRLLQRYLAFMAPKISINSFYYKYYGQYIIKFKKLFQHKELFPKFVEEGIPAIVKLRRKHKKSGNNMSYIQSQVKRALVDSTPISPSVVQGMEKQVTLLLQKAHINKFIVKAHKPLFKTKAEYLSKLNASKNLEARLVELQQAIRKAKR